jgi:hypothetical protein
MRRPKPKKKEVKSIPQLLTPPVENVSPSALKIPAPKEEPKKAITLRDLSDSEEKMTRYERLTVILSSIAVIISAVSPIGVYYWLDPQRQSFLHRARLQVTMEPKHRYGVGGSWGSDYWITTISGADELKIVNIGELPAKDVLITAQHLYLPAQGSVPSISPPYPIESNIKDFTQFITLKKPIAPHETLTVKFSGSPKVIWVSNEFGETSTVLTGAKAIRHDEKTNTDEELDVITPEMEATPRKQLSPRKRQ